jgi:leucyl aminopeptidase
VHDIHTPLVCVRVLQEGGLLGSQAVAKSYSERGANIKAQIQVSFSSSDSSFISDTRL